MAKKRAFVRYSKQGKIVPGSLILTSGSHPSGPSTWSEVPADLCCDNGSGGSFPSENSFLPWRLVTGGVAGDGVVLINQTDNESDCPIYTFIGPNDRNGTGWVYLTKYYSSTTCLQIEYEWASFDGGTEYDRPVYWTSSTEPTGIPGDLDSQVESTPDDGVWNITVPAGQWFSIGIYSSDSCCGRGFLQAEICEVPCPTTTTTTTVAPTTTTTTTTAAPPSSLYEGTLTVGGPEDGFDFGYSDGSVTPNAYGNIAPSYPPLNLLNKVGGIAPGINLYLTDTNQYQYMELYVDNVLYTLTLSFNSPPYVSYFLSTTTNPFPPVGQTCTIQIVAGPVAP